MSNLRQAAQAALEAMVAQEWRSDSPVMTNLRAALAEPQPEPVASENFSIMWTICRFALAYPTEVLLQQIGRFADALHGKEQQAVRALLLRAQNPQPQVPCTPLVPSAAPQAQQPQPFTKAQRRRLYDNSFEIHHVTFSTFSEVLDLVERAHRIGMKP